MIASGWSITTFIQYNKHWNKDLSPMSLAQAHTLLIDNPLDPVLSSRNSFPYSLWHSGWTNKALLAQGRLCQNLTNNTTQNVTLQTTAWWLTSSASYTGLLQGCRQPSWWHSPSLHLVSLARQTPDSFLLQALAQFPLTLPSPLFLVKGFLTKRAVLIKGSLAGLKPLFMHHMSLSE